MVEGFLFNRINAETAGPAVAGEHDLAVVAAAHEAQALLALVQLAEAGTDIALDPAIIEDVPVAGGKKLGGWVHSGLL